MSERYILGDLNICVNDDNSTLKQKYTDVLSTNGLYQMITEPTRVSRFSFSIIDHVIVSLREKVLASGVLHIGLNDHFFTFCTRWTQKPPKCSPKVCTFRSVRHYSMKGLCEEIIKHDWKSVTLSTDVNCCLDNFVRIFTNVLDIVAPFKTFRLKQLSEPWMNGQIKEGIRRRDAFLSRFRRTGCAVTHELYRKERNYVQQEIKLAKKTFCVLKLMNVNMIRLSYGVT
jgi:hypothetical protein